MYNLDNDSFLNSLETVAMPTMLWTVAPNSDSDVWISRKKNKNQLDIVESLLFFSGCDLYYIHTYLLRCTLNFLKKNTKEK